MSNIQAQSVTPTAITIALHSGVSVVLTAASIPVAQNTPTLASTWCTTQINSLLAGAGSAVHAAIKVYSLVPFVWNLTTSDLPLSGWQGP
jgi:hypothetical protein